MIEWLRGLFAAKPKSPATPPTHPPADGPIPVAPPPLPVATSRPPAKKRSAEAAAILAGTAETGLRARTIDLSGAEQPFTLPVGLRCYHLNLAGSTIQSLPPDLHVEFKIDLTGCPITDLPVGLKTGTLTLSQCPRLRSLPEDLEVNFLNIEGCTALEVWPASAQVSVGSLNARGCTALRALPATLGPLTNLNISDCRMIDSLPSGLQVSGWIDIADTKIQGLPDALRDVRLRWRGVAINARIAFFPETLTPAEILEEPNAEVRRVMIERLGLEQFIQGANGKVLDEDTDPGGKRQLLQIPMKGDEDLVCVTLLCPSTARQYVVRVPPTTKTCREAVAWTAGFDNPDDYRPIVET